MLHGFRFADFEFEMEATEPCSLPRYSGGVLRQGLAVSLRQAACSTGAPACAGCDRVERCGYGALFVAPEAEADVEELAPSDLTPPYVIIPPARRQRLLAGGKFRFTLRLFGRTIDHVLYCVLAGGGMHRIGPGAKDNVTLRRVETVCPLTGVRESLYTASQGLHAQLPLETEFADIVTRCPESANTVRVEFLTTTALGSGRSTPHRVSFELLMKGVLQRLACLARLHHDHRVIAPEAEWIDRARKLETVADRTHWRKWQPLSPSGREQAIAGVRGVVVYAGELTPFVPLLTLGQYTHIGLGCSLGLGRYRLAFGE